MYNTVKSVVMNLKIILLSVVMLGCFGCKQHSSEHKSETTKTPTVVNFDNKSAFREFNTLNLDDKCVNLLDPANTSETEREGIIRSWSNFHKQVNRFLEAENFDWGVSDSTISIYNRIYFDKNGTINYYVFNILNPSVSEEKKLEFEDILFKFSKDVQLELQRDQQFSQCGKTKYLNY